MLGIGVFSGYKINKSLVEKKTAQVETITSIAVVNLDGGIIQGEEIINYGSSLINIGANGFTNTGLEEARNGIKNGNYAAYIIIPATFSEKVVSLNTTPERAIISYEVNEKLREDIRESTIYKIFQFENDLKNDLGYMYLASILEEFHTTQDNAKKILGNDKKDLELLQSIKETDLVNVINIGELKAYEEYIKDLDLSEDNQLNEKLISAVPVRYYEYMALSNKELEELRSSGEDIYMDSTLSEALQKMGSFKDDGGAYVYEKGEEAVSTELSEYNSNLADAKESLKDQVSEAVGILQTEADEQLSTILGVSTDSSFEANADSVSMKFQFFKNEIKSLVEAEITRLVQEDMEGRMGTEEGIADSSIYAAAGDTLTVNINSAIEKIFYEPIESLGTTYDAYDIGLSGRTINLQNEQGIAVSDNLQDSIEALDMVDADKIEMAIQEDIIDSMKEKTREENGNLESLEEEHNLKLADFNNALYNYNPVSKIDQSEFDEIIENLYNSNTMISGKVDLKKEEYLTYADKVNETATDNVFTLKETIEVENEISNKQVTEGLVLAKESRTTTNKTNEIYLSDFIAKLPYTRLGNGPFASAYEFIIEPATFTTTSALKVNDATVKQEGITVKELFNIQDLLMVILGILIFIMIVFILNRYLVKEKKKKTLVMYDMK